MAKRTKSVLAWYIAEEDLMLPNGDNRKIVVGKTLSVDGPVKLCVNGLHASVRLYDALGHRDSGWICRVRLSGKTLFGLGKLCAENRETLWMVHTKDALRFVEAQIPALFSNKNEKRCLQLIDQMRKSATNPKAFIKHATKLEELAADMRDEAEGISPHDSLFDLAYSEVRQLEKGLLAAAEANNPLIKKPASKAKSKR